MNAFERRLDAAVEELHDSLRGEPPEQAEETLDLVRGLNFPGLLALLGASERADLPRGDAMLRSAAASVAETPAAREAGLDRAQLESVLRSWLVQRAPLVSLLGDSALRDRIAALAVTALAQRTGIEPRDARAVAELLATGEFFGDVAASTASLVKLVPRLLAALLRDVSHLPHRTIRLAAAVARDLAGMPFQVPAVLADLADGSIDNPPLILRRTLRCLYGFATIASVFETLHTLLAPDNESVRLAVLLYARANGVPLEQADLDRVRALFAPDAPGLGPALVAGLERLRKHAGTDGALRILSRLDRREEG